MAEPRNANSQEDPHQIAARRDALAGDAGLNRPVPGSIESCAITTLDFEGRFTGWNRGASRIFGFLSDEILGQHFSLLFTPEDREIGEPEKDLKQAREEGSAEDERWYVRKDGSRFWSSGITTALRDASGLLLGFAKIAEDLTERRRAEEMARRLAREEDAHAEEEEARRKTEAVLESIKDAFISVDREWHVNRKVAQSLGKKPPELVGKVLWEELPELVGTHFESEYRRAMAEQAPVEFEAFHSPTGLWLQVHAYPSAEGLSAYLHDITERKKAEEALRESEAMLSNIISISADAIVSINEDQEITIFNHGAEQTFGYTADEVLGKPLDILIPESVRSLHRRHVEEFGRSPIMARRMGERGQVTGRRKDGEIFPADASISKVVIDGKMFFTAALRDITANVHAEEALRQANENLQALIGASPLAILAVDPDDRIEIWNPAAERILGWSGAEVLGKPNPITPEDKREEYGHAVELGMHGKVVTGLETERVRKDGSRLVVSVSTAPMRGPYGEFRGLVMILEDVTRRREAEKAQRRLTAILEVTPDVVVVANPDGRLLYLNRAGRELLGLHGEEEIRERIITDFHPDWAAVQLLREAIPTVFREGSWSGETMLLTAAGRKIPVLKVLIAHRGDSGEVEYLSSVMRDITERKRVEEAEQFVAEASRTLSGSLECEELLKQVTEFIVPRLADYCIIDLIDGGGEVHREALLHRDPETQELLDRLRRFPPRGSHGLGVPHVLRTRVSDLVPEVTEALLRAISQNEEHLEILHALAPRSYIIVPLLARGRVIGAITCAFTESGRRYSEENLPLAEDLAGRTALAIENARLYEKAEESRGEAERRAREEQALREATSAVNAAFTSEDVIRRIAESALTATNSDGAYVERIDIERNEIEVVAIAGDVVPPLGARLPFSGSYAKGVVESHSPAIVDKLSEARHRLPGDLARSCPDCSAAVVPLIDAGEPFGALILVRTPEKWIFRPDESSRALTFGDLATLVFRRVHFLEESERRREELERVTESRSRLMRGFSHDVRNPLGAADGFLQLMEQGIMNSLSEKQRESVTKARRSIGTALALIEDLLEIARAEAGQLELERVPTDLAEAVREVVGEYRAAAEAKGLAISNQIPEQFPVIPSDVSRVRQILSNLVSNAVKYTPQGSVTVRVEEREGGKAPGPGRWAVAEVTDTGPGIPEEKLGLLFHEFERFTAEGETTGAGIGLAISYRLARALGGDITVESEVGRGSTFTLWLPLGNESRQFAPETT